MANSKIGMFSAPTARTILLRAGGSNDLDVDQSAILNTISDGVWCIPKSTIPKRSSGAVIGSTLSKVECDVVKLVGDTVTATGQVLKVRNPSKTADITSGVLICAFRTNFGWTAIWEDC